MINTDRIVAVTKTDLISLYGVIMALANVSVEALDAVNPGEFEVSTTAKTYLADEPIATLDFGSSVATGTVYFVPAYDFVGFTKDGAAIPNNGDVVADGASLYKAVLASTAVTITQVGF